MRKTLPIAALLLAAPAFMFSSNAFTQTINLSADQRPLETTIKGRGIARYAMSNDESRELLNNAQRYAINLPSPINESIGITDAESAAAADVELWLYAPGFVPYARCQLIGGDEVKVSPAGIEHVTYKLTVRRSGDRVRGNTCTDNLMEDPGDLQPNTGILPEVMDGDIGIGMVIVDGVPVSALSGVFE